MLQHPGPGARSTGSARSPRREGQPNRPESPSARTPTGWRTLVNTGSHIRDLRSGSCCAIGPERRFCDAHHRYGSIAARLADMNPTDEPYTDSLLCPASHRHMSPEWTLSHPSGWIGNGTNGGLAAQGDEGHLQASDRTTAPIRAHFRWACDQQRTASRYPSGTAENGSVVSAFGRVTQRRTVSSAVRRVNSWRRGHASQSPGTVTAKAPVTAAVESRSSTSRPLSRHAR